MNCREFENIVNDLARLQHGLKMINASARGAGLAHAEICEPCASRLADERALSAGLKSLAASDEGKAAPDGVEAALLEAFRARTTNPISRRTPVQSRSWPRWALAAAAAILVAFGFIVYRAIQNEPRKDEAVITKKTPARQPSVEPEERPRKVVQEIVEHQPRRKSRATPHRRGGWPQPNRPFIRDSITAYANDSEYTTDFFPLHYGGAQTPMESGEVIRVQMPRSALARFGLPVNVERADVPVKADLLIGEDGLARAIRFVQ